MVVITAVIMAVVMILEEAIGEPVIMVPYFVERKVMCLSIISFCIWFIVYDTVTIKRVS